MPTINPTPAADGSLLELVDASGRFVVDRPVELTAFGHETVVSGYDRTQALDDGVTGSLRARTTDGGVVEVEDAWSVEGPAVRLRRRVTVVEAGSTGGLRIGLAGVTAEEPGAADRWQFLLPGTLYNRNDSDGDGREDYLGTWDQDLRDDKNGLLAAMAWDSRSKRAYSIARVDKPAADVTVTDEQLLAQHFIQQTDIGSLGLRPDGEQTRLRARFPFEEEHSFSLNTAGDGWSAFWPVETGKQVELEYELRIWQVEDLTDAIWSVFTRQKEVLETKRPDPNVTLAEAVEFRQLLTQLYYRGWTKEENEKEPAGYLVHFSPRDGETRGSLLEFGFSGDQSLLAFTQLSWGYRSNVPLYRDRARSVIDFFVGHCQLRSGMSQGIYDPIHDEFTPWFTGIMMPFQYAENEEDARRYVGSQMASALLPIARELREVDGNYMRTMCESFYPILLAYELDAANGVRQPEWLDAAKRFGEFLLDKQAEDGSWNRAYSIDGGPLTEPAAWFGANHLEQRSGTIFPIPVLTVLHRITGDERYATAIRAAGEFIAATYVDQVVYVGGLNDTTHIKSVKTDAVGVMFLMRSLRMAYELTGEERLREAMIRSAKVLASFVYIWDVPMPAGSLLATGGFQSTGWASCDVIASGSYLDDEFLEFTADMVLVAQHANDRDLFDVADIVEHGMQHALSTPWNDYGYVASGIQTEGIMTAYWLSQPDETIFSGAVNKTKGDDNDTANALINGQAAYGIYQLLDRFGTDDFDVIRQAIFDRQPAEEPAR